jgi:protein ImuB
VREGRGGRPLAIVEPRRGRLFIAAADTAARALGVERGLSLSAAFGFSGSLEIIERSISAEAASLEGIASSCTAVSPAVSIEPPDAVVLEVHGSLRLFGGLSAIKARLVQDIGARGFRAALAAAPTSLGALWLVRGHADDALSLAQLRSTAKALPLEVTQWPDEVRRLLADMGLRTVGDCLRLPRGGFARRVGVGPLEDLDRALGKLPDPRDRFAAPEHLTFKTELADATADLGLLTNVILRMTERLAIELRMRQAEVRNVRLVFEHFRRRATLVRCELAHGSHDERRFTALLCDKLERMTLPVAATAVVLEAGPLEAIRIERADMFAARHAKDSESPLRLLERLRGRLGPRAVYGLAASADHRPDKAWTRVAEPEPHEVSGAVRSAGLAHVSSASGAAPSRASSAMRSAERRPLWLLPTAQRLDSPDALRLMSGPERIESGWWDEGDVARDYFVACGDDGRRLWIYLDRRRRAWFLHGMFG